MKNYLRIPALLATASLALVGCDRKPTTPPAPSGGHSHSPGDGHDHDHDHDDHGHDHAHGESVALGKLTAGGYEVAASIEGEVKAGDELHVNITVTGGEKVTAVRVWVGAADAAGSTKSKADVDGASYHAHVEVPDPVPADNKLWVEIENEKSEVTRLSFPFKN